MLLRPIFCVFFGLCVLVVTSSASGLIVNSCCLSQTYQILDKAIILSWNDYASRRDDTLMMCSITFVYVASLVIMYFLIVWKNAAGDRNRCTCPLPDVYFTTVDVAHYYFTNADPIFCECKYYTHCIIAAYVCSCCMTLTFFIFEFDTFVNVLFKKNGWKF